MKNIYLRMQGTFNDADVVPAIRSLITLIIYYCTRFIYLNQNSSDNLLNWSFEITTSGLKLRLYECKYIKIPQIGIFIV